MIPFVIVKTKSGFAYVRPEHVVAINATDTADCTILMTDGVTITATEPAEDVVARICSLPDLASGIAFGPGAKA